MRILTKQEQSVSSSINSVHSENVKPSENNLLSHIHALQHRVNNLRDNQKKPEYARFKIKQRNIFGLALIDSGNLVHSSIVSAEFWDAIGGKLNKTMD